MKQKAKRGLVIYFTFLMVGTIFLQWRIINSGKLLIDQLGLAVLLMWMPALASLGARIILKESAKDVSFKLGGKGNIKPYLTALLFPFIVGIIPYSIAWSFGLASFVTVPFSKFINVTTEPIAFLLLVLVRLSIGVVIAAIAAAGEEIGWRGYMLPRMIRAGVPFPLFVSGVIWGLWHTPLILTGQYASSPYPLFSMLLFIIGIIGLSYVLGSLRLETGSVWPCILGHAAWNSTIQSVFDYSTTGKSKEIWVGESGILLVISMATFALIYSKFKNKSPDISNEPLYTYDNSI